MALVILSYYGQDLKKPTKVSGRCTPEARPCMGEGSENAQSPFPANPGKTSLGSGIVPRAKKPGKVLQMNLESMVSQQFLMITWKFPDSQLPNSLEPPTRGREQMCAQHKWLSCCPTAQRGQATYTPSRFLRRESPGVQ